MARTTGYTATAIANLFLEGLFSMKGVFPAELLGKNETCFNYIMDYLRDRGIHYEKTSTTEQ
jgi:saccharopine dehydrogenase-like NADP-dependent oxidoreductase